MRIPISDTEVGYVTESQYISNMDGVKCRGAWFTSNDIYEGKKGYTTMTYAEFKEKYPIASNRYKRQRFVERPYN